MYCLSSIILFTLYWMCTPLRKQNWKNMNLCRCRSCCQYKAMPTSRKFWKGSRSGMVVHAFRRLFSPKECCGWFPCIVLDCPVQQALSAVFEFPKGREGNSLPFVFHVFLDNRYFPGLYLPSCVVNVRQLQCKNFVKRNNLPLCFIVLHLIALDTNLQLPTGVNQTVGPVTSR